MLRVATRAAGKQARVGYAQSLALSHSGAWRGLIGGAVLLL